eukprot:5338855-Pyramimonas_sp.AAC.1
MEDSAPYGFESAQRKGSGHCFGAPAGRPGDCQAIVLVWNSSTNVRHQHCSQINPPPFVNAAGAASRRAKARASKS